MPASARTPAAGGITVEQRSADGTWASLGRLQPRAGFVDLVVEGVTSDIVRLTAHGAFEVRFAGHLRAGVSATSAWATLAGDPGTDPILAAIVAADTLGHAMAGADTLTVRFTAPLPTGDRVRDWHLVLEGTRLGPGSTSLARLNPAPPAAPTAFAFHPNQPNPFHNATALRFDLPVGALVRVAIYDVQGRRGHVVAHRWFPPGTHTLIWDGRGAEGAWLGPGIYFATIEAGPFHSRRKMVRLP